MARISELLRKKNYSGTKTPRVEEFDPQVELILVKIRINQNWIKKLRKSGVKVRSRSRFKQQTLLEIREAQAAMFGNNPHYLNRHDRSGNCQADTGALLLDTSAGVSPGGCLYDFEVLGFRLEDVHILQKEGDRMGFLVLGIVPVPEENVDYDAQLNGCHDHVAALLFRGYKYLRIFKNPDRTVTVNFATTLQDSLPESDLRFDMKEGEVSFSLEQHVPV